MSKLLSYTMAFVFCALSTMAQNYQCIQSGVKHYFSNSNGYMRVMKIDSVKTYADSTVYYPFKTSRGSYDVASFVLSLSPGGSWLGGKVLQLNDGTFIFDSYWNDSVIIKTQAHAGDSWVFYNDTGSVYYMATVTGTDTMSVLSVTDSVKRILITAHDSAGIVVADPLDSFEIILSKNHGFAQVFDLYTFPYHMPDTAYRPGLDFMLDRSTLTPNEIGSFGGHPPAAGITVFKLVDVVMPNEQQLYDWHVDDVIESTHIYGLSPLYIYGMGTILDTVSARAVSGHVVSYTLSGTFYNCPWVEPCSLISNATTYSFSDIVFPIVDTSYMPESLAGLRYVFYHPNDNSHCLVSPMYEVVPGTYTSPMSFDFTYDIAKYKIGIGKISYYHFDDEPVYEEDRLFYMKKDGVGCGVPVDTIGVSVKSVVLPQEPFVVVPNPARNEITVTAAQKMTSVAIYNIMGREVYRSEPDSNEVRVDIAMLPAGVYVVRVNNELTKKFVKE